MWNAVKSHCRQRAKERCLFCPSSLRNNEFFYIELSDGSTRNRSPVGSATLGRPPGSHVPNKQTIRPGVLVEWRWRQGNQVPVHAMVMELLLVAHLIYTENLRFLVLHTHQTSSPCLRCQIQYLYSIIYTTYISQFLLDFRQVVRSNKNYGKTSAKLCLTTA